MAGSAMASDLKRSDFDYELPAQLIAQRPLADRAASRLLHLAGDSFADMRFRDLPALLGEGDLLLLNDTRVIKARLLGAELVWPALRARRSGRATGFPSPRKRSTCSPMRPAITSGSMSTRSGRPRGHLGRPSPTVT